MPPPRMLRFSARSFDQPLFCCHCGGGRKTSRTVQRQRCIAARNKGAGLGNGRRRRKSDRCDSRTRGFDDRRRWGSGASSWRRCKRAARFEMTIAGENTIKLSHILVGEVWIASGQSNMQMEVKYSDGAEQAIKDSDNPRFA